MRMSPLISLAGHSRREELKAMFMLKETEKDFRSNPRKSITQARSNELKGAMKAKSCDRRNEVISIKIQFRLDNNWAHIQRTTLAPEKNGT